MSEILGQNTNVHLMLAGQDGIIWIHLLRIKNEIKVSVHLTSELNQWTEQCACLKIGKGFILKGLSSLKCLFVFLLLVDLSAGKVACLHFFLSYIYALV